MCVCSTGFGTHEKMYLCMYVYINGRILLTCSLSLSVCMYVCMYVCMCLVYSILLREVQSAYYSLSCPVLPSTASTSKYAYRARDSSSFSFVCFPTRMLRWHTERQITEEDSYSDTHATHVCVVVNCVYVHRHLQDNRECIACDNA